MKHMRFCRCFFLICVISVSGNAFGQPNTPTPLEIPSSFNPVGSGARALGMGGAFIAIADDATAASWNPGGLIQLERPEISAVGNVFHRIEDNSFGRYPPAGGTQTVTSKDLNYLSAAYPFAAWDRNMIVSLNYQNLFDFTRKWNFPLETDAFKQEVDVQQEGNLYALGLAYCIQATPRLSFGVTLNIWEDALFKNEWENRILQWGPGFDSAGDPFTFESMVFDRYSFSGFNANLGMMWQITGKITVGAVIKTPFEADLSHEHEFYHATQSFVSETGDTNQHEITSSDETLDMPLSFGIGLAYRFSHELTASFDIYRTEWDDFILTDANGLEKSPVTGKNVAESDVEPTHQVRAGIEYLIITPKFVFPIRGGMFYDPAPADGNPDDYFGLALGSGMAWGRFIFDMAYQCRFGKNVGSYVMKDLDYSRDVAEHTVFVSSIVHF